MVGVISYSAGCLWPYRLVTPLLSRLLLTHPDHFTLDTRTPALSISAPTPSHPHHYLITTPRGNILTRHIVHATNAHAAHLLPGLRGLLFPVRGHMTSQRPPQPALDARGRSYSFLWSAGLDYLTQLPGDSPHGTANMVMLGGGLLQAGNNGFGELGEPGDDAVSLMASAHVAGLLPAITGKPVGVESVWTGTMGFTPDGMPWVGAVPERLAGARKRPLDGREWVVAGFCGEGMVNAWLSGVALGRMVLGEAEGAVGLPALMRMSEERVKRADLLDLAREWLT